MSKDIRSYFSLQSSKKGTNTSEVKKKEPTSNTSKKKRAVIESDSDEEVFEVKKRAKPLPSPDKKKPKIEQKTVSAADIFGSDSVKRTARKSANTASEFHDDADFDKDLLTLDETDWAATTSTSNQERKLSASPKSLLDASSSSLSRTPPKNSSRTSEEKLSFNALKKRASNLSTGNISSSSSAHSSVGNAASQVNSKKVKLERSDETLKTNESSNKRIKTEKEEEKVTSSSRHIKTEKEEDKVTSSSRHIKTEKEVMKVIKVEKKEKLSDVGALKSKLDSKINESSKVNSRAQQISESKKDVEPRAVPSPPAYMWVDKYKPASIKQIIGQQGDKSNVKKLVSWLSSWHSNHGPGVSKKHVRPSPWAKDDSGSFFKAALLSGPPGVGKTTTAHLVCKELNMDVVEFNASDTRSQKLMGKEVGELLSSKSLLPFFQSGGESKATHKHVLVMDEVDGMAGNEDRGGVAELINLIKNSKCPVICMCNDRNHPKIRSLAGHCFDLRFYKPRVEQIRGAMMSVCFKEKVQISPQALDEVIAGTNCDIRQILNNLSMWSSTDKKLNSDQVKADANAAKKIIKLGPWDAVRKIFSSEDHKSMTLMDKSDLFFHDYSLMPLFVQENYIIASPHAAKSKTETLHHLARAAMSLSYGDLVEKTIRSSNTWSLLPVQSIFSSVVPGDWMEGHLSGQIQFPAWFGKNSRGNKTSRLLQELQVHMRLSISGGKQAVNMEYLQPVLNTIVHPLVSEGAQGVPKTLQAMQDYYLTRDDLDSLLELCRWPGQSDPMASVESKVKAALTRAYNKGGIMTPYALDAPIKKKKTASTAYEEGYEGEEEGNSEDESDDESADAMIKEKKAEKKDSRANASSSQSSSSGRGSRGGSRGGRGRGRGKK